MDSEYRGLGAREGSARGAGNVFGRIRAMESLAPLRGERLLDIGCGNGAYTLAMLDGFDEAVGVDIEPDRLGDFREAVGDRPVEVLECSATDLPHADGYFDVVTAIETMEHLGRYLAPRRAVSESGVGAGPRRSMVVRSVIAALPAGRRGSGAVADAPGAGGTERFRPGCRGQSRPRPGRVGPRPAGGARRGPQP